MNLRQYKYLDQLQLTTISWCDQLGEVIRVHIRQLESMQGVYEFTSHAVIFTATQRKIQDRKIQLAGIQLVRLGEGLVVEFT